MEPQKKDKGFLTSAFSAASIRKSILTVVAGVTLAVGAAGFSTVANAQTTLPYGQQGVTSTMQMEEYKPWASDPAYQNKIRFQAERDRIDMQRAQNYAREQQAYLQAQRTQSMAYHQQNIKYLRAGKTSFWEFSSAMQQWAAQEQAFRSRGQQIQLDLQQARLSQEQNWIRFVEYTDSEFSTKEPYKTMVEQHRARNAPKPPGGR